MSLFNINQLKTSLKDGGAWSNKFKVDIKIPLLLRKLPFFKSVNLSSEYLSIMAHSASIPGREISTVNLYHRGHPFVIRGAAKFSNTFKVSFYNTPELDIHQLFSDWMYRIDSFDSAITNSIFMGNYLGAKSVGVGYMTDAYVTQYSNDGRKETVFRINYLFPIQIDDIPLDAEQTAKISSTDVTFAFSSWERDTGGGLLKSILNI